MKHPKTISVCAAFAAIAVVATCPGARAGSKAPGKATPAAHQAAAPAKNDPLALSAGFWGEVKKTAGSPEFKALKASQDCGCKLEPDKPAKDKAEKTALDKLKKAKPKPVVDIAITDPAEAARMMSESAAHAGDPAQEAALATVYNMRISKQVHEAAVPLVAPKARQRVEKFRATLSTGIPGLPGIYLGDNAHGSSYSGSQGGTVVSQQAGPRGGAPRGARPAMPAGFTPVKGGSFGCPSRH